VKEIIEVIIIAVAEMTAMPVSIDIQYMNTQEMKQDMCVHPESPKCMAYPAIHPPMSKKVIINTDIDLRTDLGAQGAVVHTITIAAMEQSGMLSPNMPCKTVGALHIKADQIQEMYLLAVADEYVKAGKTPPKVVKYNQFPMFCVPEQAVQYTQ
jgi:hypothetical protein